MSSVKSKTLELLCKIIINDPTLTKKDFTILKSNTEIYCNLNNKYKIYQCTLEKNKTLNALQNDLNMYFKSINIFCKKGLNINTILFKLHKDLTIEDYKEIFCLIRILY